jgi:hypothetical protein
MSSLRFAASARNAGSSGPNPTRAFEDALTLAGSPDPRNDRVCITSLCPHQFPMTCLPEFLMRMRGYCSAREHGSHSGKEPHSRCRGESCAQNQHQIGDPGRPILDLRRGRRKPRPKHPSVSQLASRPDSVLSKCRRSRHPIPTQIATAPPLVARRIVM